METREETKDLSKGEPINKLRELNKMVSEAEQKNKQCIDLLHCYNEVKDITQTLLGVIANIEGVTVKELHNRYNLPLTD